MRRLAAVMLGVEEEGRDRASIHIDGKLLRGVMGDCKKVDGNRRA